MKENIRLVSAVLFLNPNGITLKEISNITKIKESVLIKTLESLKARYRELGLELIHQDKKYMLLVTKDITTLNSKSISQTDQLSNSALEVLSIIAYKQPISRDEIEDIRGVGSEQSIRGLLERDLIEQTKQKKGGIVHIRYVTTILFLKQLGIRSLKELPKKG